MSRSALLVMDVQQGIVDYFVKDPAYVPRLREVIGAARAAGVAVIFVMTAFRADYPEVSRQNKVLAVMPRTGAFTEGHPSTRLHPALGARPDDIVVNKKRASAFMGSDLDVVLRSGGIDHLVLTGIATGGAVGATLQQAADLDFRLTVPADGCMDPDPEVHRVLVERLFPRFTEVTTTAEWGRR
ncbi:nicotinamidase-related amidase [Kitasatospora sp. GP30]|uniref:cysteine hydrolase family protein n=1 Tax=Kitasatospora sp. GP30 TaxID=3035084 RepID=UPI000C71248B|nr:cysteine hydrolase [Kitasatospora sp. GP30]MDH6145458.1 nicotinamidase-related amidase [Kitasatospora sp. GP30]